MKIHSTTPLQITDRFGAQTAFASLRLPDGTEAAVPAEHAAAIYVNEQPAFRVVCTPALLPQLALGEWVSKMEKETSRRLLCFLFSIKEAIWRYPGAEITAVPCGWMKT